MLQQFGKVMLIVGAVIAGVGGLLYLLGRLGIMRLPGDVSLGGRNWRVYLPIGTCIILSILATLIVWLISRLRR